MSTILIVLLAAALYHFILESIIAPSVRLELRFKLFRLRDELRELKRDHADGLDDKHFHFLQNSINSQIANLHRYDIASFYSADREYRRNAEFRALCDARLRVLDDCNVPAAREVRRQSVQVVGSAIGMNSGGWVITILPVVLGAACVKLLQMGFGSALRRMIRTLASLQSRDLDRVANDRSAGLPA